MIENLNYTQIPNIFIEKYMQKISSNAVKVFLVICRKTIGWHKTSDKISYSQLKEITGIKRHETIQKAIKELLEYNLITQFKTENGYLYDLNIQENKDKTMLKNSIDENETMLKNSMVTNETMLKNSIVDEKTMLKNSTTKEIYINKENIINKKTQKQEKKEFKTSVLLTEEEYKKLCDRFTKDLTDKAIDYLSLYKQEKTYKTKSDYLAIIRWVIDAVKRKYYYNNFNKNLNKNNFIIDKTGWIEINAK